MEIKEIDINKITPNPSQTRTVFDKDALKELAGTIKEHGLLQPIVVNKTKKGYELIAGERRLRASKLANVKKITAIVKDVNAEQQAEESLIENIQRENLEAFEVAHAIKKIEKNYKNHEELANTLGLSVASVERYLTVVDLSKSSYSALQAIDKDKGEHKHESIDILAAIATIKDQPLQKAVIEKTKDWTYREARELIPIIKRSSYEVANEIMDRDYDVETAKERLDVEKAAASFGGVKESEEIDDTQSKYIYNLQNDINDISKRFIFMVDNFDAYDKHELKNLEMSLRLLIQHATDLHKKIR